MRKVLEAISDAFRAVEEKDLEVMKIWVPRSVSQWLKTGGARHLGPGQTLWGAKIRVGRSAKLVVAEGSDLRRARRARKPRRGTTVQVRLGKESPTRLVAQRAGLS